MGDRANIKVIQSLETQPLYLYTHWNGYEWNARLARALLFGESRWGDSAYLTRILVSRMFYDIADSVTGGGIGVNFIPDNEYPIIVVDIQNQVVYIEDTDIKESFDSYSKREHPEMHPTEVDSILKV